MLRAQPLFDQADVRALYAAVKGSSKVLGMAPPVHALVKTRAEEHVKGMITPGALFEEFGFNYLGPIDGHDLDTLGGNPGQCASSKGPAVGTHVVTKRPRLQTGGKDPIAYHGVSRQPGKRPGRRQERRQTQLHPGVWRLAVRYGWQDRRLVGITPAMREGSGMVRLPTSTPTAILTWASPSNTPSPFAAGLACEGIKPVVAIYSTFCNARFTTS